MIIITMAGAGKRFSDAGFALPKYALPYGRAKFVFDYILKSLSFNGGNEKIIFFTDGSAFSESFVKWRLREAGLCDRALIRGSPMRTTGQAHSAFIALTSVDFNPDERLVIFNIDTVRLDPSIPEVPAGVFGMIEVTCAEGDHWSFVDPCPDLVGEARRVAEKKRISHLCSTGLYVFRTCGSYIDAFNEYRKSDLVKEYAECFVAPMYQWALNAGLRVRYFETPRNNLLFAGTPDEYKLTREAPLT